MTVVPGGKGAPAQFGGKERKNPTRSGGAGGGGGPKKSEQAGFVKSTESIDFRQDRQVA